MTGGAVRGTISDETRHGRYFAGPWAARAPQAFAKSTRSPIGFVGSEKNRSQLLGRAVVLPVEVSFAKEEYCDLSSRL